jgi:hypothetical protein
VAGAAFPGMQKEEQWDRAGRWTRKYPDLFVISETATCFLFLQAMRAKPERKHQKDENEK